MSADAAIRLASMVYGKRRMSEETRILCKRHELHKRL
jgi:hypothetical protein